MGTRHLGATQACPVAMRQCSTVVSKRRTGVNEMSAPSLETSRQRPLIALIPPAIGAVVAWLLRDAEAFAQLGSSLASVLISGLPLYQRAVRSDREKSPTPPQDPHNPGASPQPAVKAGPLTVALSVVLGASAFWLIDLL